MGAMVWKSVYMSLIFSPPSLCVSWPTLVLVHFLKVEVRIAVERGDLSSAVVVLESCRRALLETISVRAGDGLCVALGVELKEMQERMANMRIYETSGRAYMLSGLSSHSWQRSIAIEPMNYRYEVFWTSLLPFLGSFGNTCMREWVGSDVFLKQPESDMLMRNIL